MTKLLEEKAEIPHTLYEIPLNELHNAMSMAPPPPPANQFVK